MDIIIQNTSGKPIYEQITAQIKEPDSFRGLAGRGRLPSMRLLAKAAHQRHHHKARL